MSELTCSRCNGNTFSPHYAVTVANCRDSRTLHPLFVELGKQPEALICGTCSQRYIVDFDGEIVKEKLQ